MSENANKGVLKIKLYAGTQLVKESGDEVMWAAILNKLLQNDSSGTTPTSNTPVTKVTPTPNTPQEKDTFISIGISPTDAMSEFAQKVGVTIEQIKGACRPETNTPYMHLDYGCYEKFKKEAPAKGPKSVAPVTMAATLLCIWFEVAGLPGSPRRSDTVNLLRTVNLEAANVNRSIRNCSWLQMRDGLLNINPAEYSLALSVIKAFCNQNWAAYRTGDQ